MTIVSPPLPSSRPTQILFKSINDQTVEDNASYKKIYMYTCAHWKSLLDHEILF